MFTGIIEHLGTLVASRTVPGGRRLRVDVGAALAADCKHGDSVAVSGVCLTVAAIEGPHLEFDVVQETLSRTTLGDRKAGDWVNLERSLRVGDRLDGHFVQGHVDGKATVERVVATPKEHVLAFRAAEIADYLIPKGSITVDGVSLTIAEARGDMFSVALVPTTLERTTLSGLKAGDVANVESDILSRTVVHHLSARAPGGLTMQKLHKAGFA